MVLNLDRCIGCDACSVACKNEWSSGPAMEHAWFNNVERRPGEGSPEHWENQARWGGGWVRNRRGRIRPRQGGTLGMLLKIATRRHKLPEPAHYDERYARDDECEDGPRALAGDPQSAFAMHLPRLCEQCLNPTCVASCPSGAIQKREEDGIVAVDPRKCHGWRMCVSACPYKKIYYNPASRKAEKCSLCRSRVGAGQPTVCSEICVGQARYVGVLLYDADRIEAAARVEDPRALHACHLGVLCDPRQPDVIEHARKDGVPESWVGAAQDSPVWKMAVEWKVALPLHPEYRTLPMVWYVPPLSRLMAVDGAALGAAGARPGATAFRVALKGLADLLTAGDEAPLRLSLERMLAVRAYFRALHVDRAGDPEALRRAGLTREQAQEMYRYMAIASEADRFVVPAGPGEGARVF